jgi:7-cyano-7-deazaguanine synthase
MDKVVSVLSGGLDSTILLYKLVKEYGAENVFALTFQYGQRHSIEVEKAKISCRKLDVLHHIIDISFLGTIIKDVSALAVDSTVKMPTIKDVIGDPQPVTEVPYRNMMLSTIALSYAQSNGCKKIFLGLQAHDEYQYWDTSRNFVDLMNDISMLNRKYQITIEAPFIDMAKVDEIKIGIELNVPFDDTHTCYDPTECLKVEPDNLKNVEPVEVCYSCGICPSCSERIMNFAKAGMKDPIPYSIDIPWENILEDG